MAANLPCSHYTKKLKALNLYRSRTFYYEFGTNIERFNIELSKYPVTLARIKTHLLRGYKRKVEFFIIIFFLSILGYTVDSNNRVFVRCSLRTPKPEKNLKKKVEGVKEIELQLTFGEPQFWYHNQWWDCERIWAQNGVKKNTEVWNDLFR